MAAITRQMLERRVSAKKILKIFNDGNTGTPDHEAIMQLIDDAESKVLSYLAPIGLSPIPDPAPREVQRLILDVCVALLAQRHPEAMAAENWVTLMEQAEKDLCKLRDGKTMLGAAPPDPAANHGGAVYNNAPVDASTSSSCEPDGGFWDRMGDW